MLHAVGLYERSFIHYSNAINLLEDQSAEHYPIKQIIYCQLARVHLEFHEYDIAIDLFKKSVNASSIYDRYYYVMTIHNGLGYSYRQLNRLDSSNHWFAKTYEKAVLAKDTVWQAIIQGNLGENYYLQQDYERAKPLLLQDLSWARSNRIWGNASNSLAILADIHFEQGHIIKAEKLIAEAADFAHRAKSFKRLLKVYPVLMKLSAARSDAKMVAAYLDSINRMNDSIAHKFDRLLLTRAEQKLELDRIATQNQKLEKQLIEQLSDRNMLIVGLFIFLVALGLLFNRHRLKTIEERKRAASELKIAELKLKNFLSTIQLKTVQLQQSESDLKELKDAGSTENEKKNHLQELQKATILTDSDWDNFQQLFNQVHGGYLRRLMDKHSDLSQADIHFVALLKMKLSPKQMMAVLGVGDGAIRQYRLRLRNKLQLSETKDLVAFVESI